MKKTLFVLVEGKALRLKDHPQYSKNHWLVWARSPKRAKRQFKWCIENS